MRRPIVVQWKGSKPPTRQQLRVLARAIPATRGGPVPKFTVEPAHAVRVRVNPEGSRAAFAYQQFHWGEPARVQRKIAAPRYGREVFVLGDLAEIAYDTSKGRERARWVHKFKRPRPLLTATPDGRLGPIVGGRVRVTARGIE